MCAGQFTGEPVTPLPPAFGLGPAGRRRWRRRWGVAPSAAERAIERDESREPVAARLNEGGLGGQEQLKRVQDFEVRREARLVPQRREADGRARRVDGTLALRLLRGELLDRDEIARNFSERTRDRLLVRHAGLVELRSRDALLRPEAASREERTEEARPDGPGAAGREEILEAWAEPAEKSGDAQRGIERRARHADVRVRGDETLLGGPHVRPPQKERRRQARGHDRRHRLLGERGAPRYGPG